MGRPALKQPPPADSLHAKLRVIEGPQKGRSFRVLSSHALIGRSSGECDIFLDDPYCSRKHALLVKDEAEGFVLQRISKEAKLAVNKKNIEKYKPLQNKDILTIGQTKIKFETLDPKKKSLPAAALLKSPPLRKQRAGSNAPSQSKKSRLRMIIVIIVFAGIYLFLSEQPPAGSKAKEGIKMRTEQDIESDIQEVAQLEESLKKEKKRMRSQDYKNAQIAYIRGIRDYRQGLFGRARESFRVCKTLYPRHKLCSGYLKKSQIKYEKLTQRNMVLGKQYRKQNQFRQCAASFKTVMTMMAYNTSHPLYKEAVTNFRFCSLQTQERY